MYPLQSNVEGRAAMSVRYYHRVLEHDLDKWTTRGWRVVLVEENSPSLRAQGMRVALIERDEKDPEARDGL
jgi:hypothetical protein